jgi:hypothetical protein
MPPRELGPAWTRYPEACEDGARARGARHRGPVTEAALPASAATWTADERAAWLASFGLAAAQSDPRARLAAAWKAYRAAVCDASRRWSRLSPAELAKARAEIDRCRAAVFEAEAAYDAA